MQGRACPCPYYDAAAQAESRMVGAAACPRPAAHAIVRSVESSGIPCMVCCIKNSITARILPVC